MRPFGLVAAALVMASGGLAEARTPTEELRGLFASASAVLDDASLAERPAERLDAIRRIVDASFHFPAAAELSLRREWAARTAAERQEFVRLFTALLQGAFVSRMASLVRIDGGLQVSYLGETVDGDGATVQTTMLNRAGGETPLTYRMLRRGSQWAIRDVIVDGVSVVGNYQAQFSRIIHTSSYAELLGRLRARLAEPGLWVAAAESQREPVPAPVETSLREGRVRLDRVEVNPEVPRIVQPALDRAEPPERAAPATALRAVLATAVAAAPPRAPAVAFWVQVGSFRSMEAARRLIARLRGERFPVPAEPGPAAVGEAGHTFARVRVGPFGTRAEAAARLRELQARGFRPFIAEARE